MHRVEVPVGPCERVAEALRAPGDRVLVDVGIDRALGGFLHLGRRGEIGESLREVDRAVDRREPRHLADHRLRESDRPSRDTLARETHQYPAV